MNTPKSAPPSSVKRQKPRLSVTFATSPHREEEKEEDPNYGCSDSVFHWDDEATLLDELMDKPPKEDGDATALALADSLRSVFAERGQVTKAEVARVFVSSHSEVKRALSFVADQDDFYGKCVVTYAKGCKRSEAVYMRVGKIIERCIANQVQLERLRVQLKAALAEREAIWTRLENSAKNILKPLRERIQDVPAHIERKITQQEEEARALEKRRQNSIPKNLQKYLKSL